MHWRHICFSSPPFAFCHLSSLFLRNNRGTLLFSACRLPIPHSRALLSCFHFNLLVFFIFQEWKKRSIKSSSKIIIHDEVKDTTTLSSQLKTSFVSFYKWFIRTARPDAVFKIKIASIYLHFPITKGLIIWEISARLPSWNCNWLHVTSSIYYNLSSYVL